MASLRHMVSAVVSTSKRLLMMPGPSRPAPGFWSSIAIRVLVGCWALLSAAAGLFAFLGTTMPVRYSVATQLLPAGPSWIPAGLFVVMVLAVLLVTLSMALLLLPLLAGGFFHVRRHARPGLVAAWAAAAAAAVCLEMAYLTNFGSPHTSVNYTGPAVPDWAHLADTAGFMAIGAVMIWILTIASRLSLSRDS
jgi:hypothetical protein